MTTITEASQAFANARRERSLYVRHLVSGAMPSKRSVSMFAAAFLVATGVFWAVILTSPPLTSAAQTSGSSGVPVFEMMRDAPALPQLEADAF